MYTPASVETKLADIHKCMTRPGILYLCSMQLRKFPFNMSWDAFSLRVWERLFLFPLVHQTGASQKLLELSSQLPNRSLHRCWHVIGRSVITLDLLARLSWDSRQGYPFVYWDRIYRTGGLGCPTQNTFFSYRSGLLVRVDPWPN